MVPGARSAALLEVLEREKLSRAGRIDALKALERHVAWLQARQVGLLADVDADGVEAAPDERWPQWDVNWACDEVACALRLSSNTAADRLAVATALDERFPATVTLLEAGEICYLQARAMTEITHTLDPETASAVEAMVVGTMPSQSVGQTRRAVNRAVLKADPEGADKRHRRRKEDRAIWHQAAEDGMATWTALLPAHQAAQLDAAVDAHAATYTDTDRTLTQKRVDALYDLVVNRPTPNAVPGGTTPMPGGRSAAVVQITVSLDTLIGADEEPGDLKGYGPIGAAAVREVAFAPGTIWRRLITHPRSGLLIKTDPTTYRPTTETRRHVITRDHTCTFPTCHMPAHRCDLDHIQPFNHTHPETGGHSEPDNLIPLCRHHHLLKHHTPWTVTRDTHTGTTHWTAPTGHHYTNPPHTH
ncbi:HNH endonuclease signature motif containing protein, partial [Streptomyces zingiberis]